MGQAHLKMIMIILCSHFDVIKNDLFNIMFYIKYINIPNFGMMTILKFSYH